MRKFSRRSRRQLEGLLWFSLTQLLCFLWLKEQAGIQELDKQVPFLNEKAVYVDIAINQECLGSVACVFAGVYVCICTYRPKGNLGCYSSTSILFIEAWSVSHLEFAKYPQAG